MIISVWRPKTKTFNKKQQIIYYELSNNNEIYEKGSSNLRIVYKCDSLKCKRPEKIYSIGRHHLTEERSKTVNEKIQICRSCQTMGENNPRYGDNRTWDELFTKEKSKQLKKIVSDRTKGQNNPSKKDSVKTKKNQIIINFENVNKYLNKLNFKLNSINGDNKFAILNIQCENKHNFDIQWTSFTIREKCRYCYYESIRIPFDQIEEFELYSKTVRSLTRFSFNKNIEYIENSKLKIIDSKNYHIDHIYSISDGFLNNIDPRIISSYINLRVISKVENLKKGKTSQMLLTELIDKYRNIN